jgi:hypothetical protein
MEISINFAGDDKNVVAEAVSKYFAKGVDFKIADGSALNVTIKVVDTITDTDIVAIAEENTDRYCNFAGFLTNAKYMHGSYTAFLTRQIDQTAATVYSRNRFVDFLCNYADNENYITVFIKMLVSYLSTVKKIKIVAAVRAQLKTKINCVIENMGSMKL